MFTRIRVGQPRICGSITDLEKTIHFSKASSRLWNLPSMLFSDYRALSPGVTLTTHCPLFLKLILGGTPPFPHIPLRLGALFTHRDLLFLPCCYVSFKGHIYNVGYTLFQALVLDEFYFKYLIAFYLISWREKVVPTDGSTGCYETLVPFHQIAWCLIRQKSKFSLLTEKLGGHIRRPADGYWNTAN